jgi:hypothetical protein
MDEAFDEWSRGKRKWVDGWNGTKFTTDGYHSDFDHWSDTDLRDMILRDRNHPSIILWSIGNEIDYVNDAYPPNSPELPPIAARLIRIVKSLDVTRPVTAACASIATNLFYPQLDVVGYNYQEGRYDQDHAEHPDRVIYGSENKHDLAAWQAVADHPFIAGQFLWTGIDYMGESRGWPNRASADGLLDLAGFRKPQFYFRQSLWSDQPMVYLTPSAAGRGLTCYTNCPSVELIQNGKSLGEKSLPPSRVIHWPVSVSAGLLKAVGKRDGHALCTVELKPAGPARKLAILQLTPLVADGWDVRNVEVRVTDADGNLVPIASDAVTFSLSGPAHLLAIENGDVASHDSGQGPTHNLFHGRAMVYIQSENMPGNVTLKVTAPNLEPATVTVQSSSCPRPVADDNN